MWSISCAVLVVASLLGEGCGNQQSDATEVRKEGTPVRQPIVEFTDKERQLLRDLKIAIFRNKVILNAQPSITDAQLAEVEKKLDGKVSPELLALWKTSFGGELDYDYQIAFGDFLYTASLRELFYPESKRYNDLHGWIDHEIKMEQESAKEQGMPIPQRTRFLPFAGFEYLQRFYVSLSPDEYGQVIVYAQGIPWKGRLNEDSVAVGAKSVADLFDQLSLDEDPFDKDSSEYASGKDMVDRILEIEADHPQLAKKLRGVVRSAIFDWRAVIETTDFKARLSNRQSKALRLALEFAVNRKDVSVIDRLHKKGAPFNITLRGRSGVLGMAMKTNAFDVVDHLLDLNVDLGEAPILDASKCSDEMLLRLIKRGVRFDEDAIYSAAETGTKAGAIALANSTQIVAPKTTEQIATAALERATRHDEDAVKVETRKLGSYLTAAQYREQAKALRDFAIQLRTQ